MLWRSLKDAARNLKDKEYAVAANSSYYCIFHAIRSVLIVISAAYKSHSGNISEFRRSFIKTGVFPVEY